MNFLKATLGEEDRYIFEFGPFRLDAHKRLLMRDGQTIKLFPKEFDMLLALVERSGEVLDKDELLKRVWAGAIVEESNLTTHISHLRKILGEKPDEHQYIVTVPGRGYRFVAGVRAAFDEVQVRERTRAEITIEEETDVEKAAETALNEVAFGRNESLGSENTPSVAALAAAVQTASVKPPRASAGHRSVMLPVALATLAALAAAFGLYRLLNRNQTANEREAPFKIIAMSRLTSSGNTIHAAISPDGEYVAHVTEGAEGHSLWLRHVSTSSNVRIAGPATTQYVWTTFSPDGDYVYYLTLERNKGDTALYRVPVLGGPSSMAAYNVGPVGFSPDGRQMAFFRMYGAESRLIVAGADGSNERTLAMRRQPDSFRAIWNAPAWSPDGKLVACPVRRNDDRGHFETVVAVSVEDGAEKQLTAERWSYVGQSAWLSDGSGLVVAASESATAPEQVWHVLLKNGAATRVTHDLNDYHDLSLTADSSKLAAVQIHSVSSIWVAPEGDASRGKQIASEVGLVEEVAWTPDGRIVYRSNAGGGAEIWVMNADGSNPKQLSVGARASRGLAVTPDGRHIVFASDRAGKFNIWRVDARGGDLTQLTSGDGEFYPHCTPDGQWVVYQRGEIEGTLWKVPTGGGASVQLTTTRARGPAVSPDGKLVAYHYLDPDLDKSQRSIGIVSSEGGPRLKQFDFPPTVAHRFVRWSPDRQSIAYPNSPGGLSDIWIQPLDGGMPKQLTNFKAEQILAFDWSPDGRSLAIVRGVETSDVVIINSAK